MSRRLLGILAALVLGLGAVLATASPTIAAAGQYEGLYDATGSYIQLRSFDPEATPFTIQVRAATSVYLPAGGGVLPSGGQTFTHVAAPGGGDGPLYIVSFLTGGTLFINHPDDWGWDF